MYSFARLNELYDVADAPECEGFDAAHDYLQAFVDHVPQSIDEAMHSLDLACDLMPDVEPIREAVRREGRSLEALIELRRLVAIEREDGSVPPLRYETRVLRSLIAWMSSISIVDY